MCIGGRLGMDLNMESDMLFSEVNGCLLVEVSPLDASTFEKLFSNLPYVKIANVQHEPILKIPGVEIPVEELIRAFNSPTYL
jgi:hypothetical protein